RRRRPLLEHTPASAATLPTHSSDVVWIEPYPDLRLEALADNQPGPEARYETREAISLAFVVALQLLPPRQRAVLILRDVLGFRGSEVAQFLHSTDEAVSSALKRARMALQGRSQQAAREPAAEPNSEAERELVERLTSALEAGDVNTLVQLLTADV